MSKRQEETTEKVPTWKGIFLILFHFYCPFWHSEGKELSSDLLFSQRDQDFVAISKFESGLLEGELT